MIISVPAAGGSSTAAVSPLLLEQLAVSLGSEVPCQESSRSLNTALEDELMLLRLLDLKMPAAAIIILQLACHPGVLAAVSPGLHVHLRVPHPQTFA